MRTTHSIVAFTDDGERLVETAGQAPGGHQSGKTIFAVKRLVGPATMIRSSRRTRSSSPTDHESQQRRRLGRSRWQDLFASQISAFTLQKMKETAKPISGRRSSRPSSPFPAYFNDAQRQATKDAGKIAGLEVLRIIHEATAAALAYGLDKAKQGIIAVYDLGGGTFDISVLEIGDGVFEVKSTNGDTFLGGEDFDMRLVNYLADEFQKEQGIDLRKDKLALQRLKESAEKAKIELSSTTQTEVNLPFITADASGPKHLTMKLTRAKFEALVDDLIQRTIEPCRKALKDAGLYRG